MMRTQIQLTTDQHRRLKRWARELGISMSEAVRRCVEGNLSSRRAASDRKALLARALAVMGKYEDPAGEDVAADHDRHLAGIYGR